MVQPNTTAIREKRIKAGYSMRSLAAKARIHYATISNLERPGHNVSPSTAKALCDALDVPFDEIFTIIRGGEAS